MKVKYTVTDFVACLHSDEDGCECRKPKPGMLMDAARRWNIDFLRSFMIGDTEKDMDAGNRAGCRTILIRASYNTAAGSAWAVVDSIQEAVSLAIAQSN